MGHVYLYYGTGAGKTACALGLALRSAGHDKKAVIVQFMKWWKETGEFRIRERLAPYYEIRQFGRPGWICRAAGKVSVGGISLKVREIDGQDKEMARRGMEYARQALVEKPGLLVLDEICLAAHMGILPVEDVLRLLQEVPDETDVVLTGRFSPGKLMERADFVNEIVSRKAPGKFVTTPGIQF